MTRTEEYAWCQRQGMTVSDTARHCGVSRPAVSQWAKRNRVTFSRGPTLMRQLEMRYYAYPWEEMQVGDYFEANCPASAVAHYGNVTRFPKRFRSITRDGANIVVRAA